MWKDTIPGCKYEFYTCENRGWNGKVIYLLKIHTYSFSIFKFLQYTYDF